MKKSLLFLAALAVSSALCAQEGQNFTRDDVFAAFQEYNPAALQRADSSPAYRDLLEKVAAAYTAPKTDENQNQLIALVKNFDNSLRLQAVKETYANSRTLQQMSGTQLADLDERTTQQLQAVVQDIFKQTLQVKQIQVKRYKQQIKATKKDASLSAEQKTEQVAALQAQIRAVKTEVRNLKKSSSQKIQDTAKVYFADMRSEYDKQHAAAEAPEQQLQVEQSAAHDVKANHKKPVAK